jgi:hypothetical protein
MHFLSHYYVDRNKNNPLFVSGALLPDIAGHFTRTYNSKIRYKEWDLGEPAISVHRGVLRHYELDAMFHTSLVFKESCKNAGHRLADEGLDREKYRFWFLSHIIVEVILDRQLMIADPHLITAYYDVLSSVDTAKLNVYLEYICTKEERNKILTSFIRFLDVRFLQYLDKIEGAAEAIVRTVYKATGISFTEKDRERLIAALHNIENDIRYRSEKLLDI